MTITIWDIRQMVEEMKEEGMKVNSIRVVTDKINKTMKVKLKISLVPVGKPVPADIDTLNKIKKIWKCDNVRVECVNEGGFLDSFEVIYLKEVE